MFKYFKRRRELKALANAFEELAALSAWTAITIIEKNQSFFDDNQSEFENARKKLDEAAGFADRGNHRWASNCYQSFIGHIATNHPQLVNDHSDIVAALTRIRKLQQNTIDPLWSQYADSVR